MPPKHFSRRPIPDLLEDGFADASNTTMLDAAVAYAKQQLYVFPLQPINEDGSCSCSTPRECAAGKHPLVRLVPNGHKDATIDVTTSKQWWAMWHDAGIGIELEQSNLVVVAPDSPAWLREFEERGLPATAVVQSGGGKGHMHFYYRRPEGCPVRRICKSGKYDIVSGGYVVAPPTLHESGDRYTWIDPIESLNSLPYAPDWVIEELRERSGSQSRSAERKVESSVIRNATQERVQPTKLG